MIFSFMCPKSVGKLAEILQMRKVPLAQHLVHSDSDGVGKIERARIAYHRQTHTPVKI